ncbi:hypothetical protein QN400_21360 [Pseudomonas sp. RTC3]|uniref:hypothetical protein n=1 Tax=Pseudomonas sp. 5C2 TaxID=3048588 RepID=UPI002AB3D439|nr:hypothetical protein [Pseudomonas sp. 5C2]MDY7567503.1 hypothetical protein [Pseudomonas sp. 5C2]MEB0064565.1 hypothetical protein [Pseudomonas sp. RTC3]MEB0243027.1 hypothetical protein [Pseudomonas sp. 5C2]
MLTLERLARVIHGMFSQIAHSTSLKRVSASFMGLFHNTSFGLDLASFYLIHGVNFTNAPFDALSWGVSQNGVDRPHSWGRFRRTGFIHGVRFSQRSFNIVFASFRLIHGVISQTSIRPVKNTAIPWKPALYRPRKGSAFGGNQRGNLTPGNLVGSRQHCEPVVRTSGANLLPVRAPQCVPGVRTGLRTNAVRTCPGGVFRALQDA